MNFKASPRRERRVVLVTDRYRAERVPIAELIEDEGRTTVTALTERCFGLPRRWRAIAEGSVRDLRGRPSIDTLPTSVPMCVVWEDTGGRR